MNQPDPFMNILVTGSNGQLGSELRMLAPSFPRIRFIFTDVAELDITSETAIGIMMSEARPAVVINCAAYTAVDRAESDAKTAFLINATAAGNLAVAAAKHKALLIHVSTDYVFDGKSYTPYREDDPASPVSVYARSKHAGELLVHSMASDAVILRTSWLYSEFGHNFIKTVMKLGRERGEMKIVFDQTGSPTYARDLAKVILEIALRSNEVKGVEVFHYSNEGVASWYDLAQAIAGFAGIECKIHPILTSEYPLPAVRPFYSVFNKSKIRERFGLTIPYWRDSLRECMVRIALPGR